MNEYYVIDLARTNVRKGITVFIAADMRSRTRFLENAGRFSEAIINADLERFDNGQTTRAMLTSALRHSGKTIVPIKNLHMSRLFYTQDAIVRRQAR